MYQLSFAKPINNSCLKPESIYSKCYKMRDDDGWKAENGKSGMDKRDTLYNCD